MDKQKEYLHKVIEQIVSETRFDRDERRLYTPFTSVSLYFPTTIHFYNPTLFSPFSEHCKNIYGLNKEETDYVWDEYKDKIERNKNTITESEEITVKDSIFLRKIIKYLKDNTKVVIEPFDIYDGYIIAPIGNGFRWDFYHKTIQPDGDFVTEWWEEMLEVYGLSSKEVLIVMGIYQDFIWETLEKISDGR